MRVTPVLLASLEVIVQETTVMLHALDEDGAVIAADTDRREAKRRVVAIRSEAQESLEWLSDAHLEEPGN